MTTVNAKEIIERLEEHKERQKFNMALFNILEGDVKTYIENAIRDQLSPRSASTAIKRLPPINILRKVVNKLTRLYSIAPLRKTAELSDMELLGGYEQSLDVNNKMSKHNYNYNGYKYGALKIVEGENGQLFLRTILPTQFLPMSSDLNNPTAPDMIVEFAGMVGTHKKYWIYTDDSFTAILENGATYQEDMKLNEGINPYGVIPFSYVSGSDYLLIPEKDADMLTMPVLIPLLMAEVNFGMQFLANPVVYGVNLNLENLHISPDTILNIKGDEMGSEKNQSLNVLQPQMDIPNQSKWISQDLLGSWLESKDIRATTMTGTDNIVSGINLMIREMDTTENVKRQAVVFKSVEADFWDRIAKMHNVIVDSGRLSAGKFSSDEIGVTITYAEQKPLEDRMSVVNAVKAEIDAGLLSKKSAMMRLSPDLSEEQIDEELTRISEEKSAQRPVVDFNGSSEELSINEGDV